MNKTVREDEENHKKISKGKEKRKKWKGGQRR